MIRSLLFFFCNFPLPRLGTVFERIIYVQGCFQYKVEGVY
jgi:hypothetical protein